MMLAELKRLANKRDGRMHYVDDGPSDGPPVVLGTDNTLRKEKDRMTKEQTTGGRDG